MVFPCAGNVAAWDLSSRQIAEWRRLFPGLDIERECLGALAWVKANRLKTAKGMPAFLVRWFGKAQDRSYTIGTQGRDRTDVTHEAAARFLALRGGAQ